MKYNLKESFFNIEMEDLSLPPNLRISTITATSKINSNINIEKVYNFLEVSKNFRYIEFGNKDSKGTSQKKISLKKKEKKKVFFNQITIEVEYNNVINNIKLFNNGSISMTGVKDINTGKGAIKTLFDYLIKDKTIFENNNPKIEFFKIVLINSDFKFDFEIKRSELHQLLVNNYKIYSSYEPCIYPGVNSKYYWNKKYTTKTVYANGLENNNNIINISYDIYSQDIPHKMKIEINSFEYKEKYLIYLEKLFNIKIKCIEFDFTYEFVKIKIINNIDSDIKVLTENIQNKIETKDLELCIDYTYKGSCYCDGFCEGKGSGFGEQQCKKVTISAFQSGSIIITGANSTKQITDSYNFINDIINSNIDRIKKNKSLCKKDNYIYIKKSSIINPSIS